MRYCGDESDDPGMLPRQWLSPLIRWPLRVLALPFVLLDVLAQRVAAVIVPPPNRRCGRCGRCGKCCHYILITKPRSLLGRLHLLWNTQVNGFYMRAVECVDVDGEEMMVMSCRYLLKNGMCRNHLFRPLICRQWPRVERFGTPMITEGCCYRAEQRR